MQERIYKQMPKQRRSVENYEAPFPVPEVPRISDEVMAAMLDSIDEVLCEE